jgi:hypothetical protein
MTAELLAETGRVSRRFRVTVEGVTSYVGHSGDSADVTLTMPGGSFAGDTHRTRELRIGSMPLRDVEWLPDPDPVKVGDTVKDRHTYRSLPVGAVVANGFDIHMRTADGFVDARGNTNSADTLAHPRTVVYLPPISYGGVA